MGTHSVAPSVLPSASVRLGLLAAILAMLAIPPAEFADAPIYADAPHTPEPNFPRIPERFPEALWFASGAVASGIVKRFGSGPIGMGASGLFVPGASGLIASGCWITG